MLSPFTVMFPEKSFSSPAKIRKIVLLPQPLGPIRETNWFS